MALARGGTFLTGPLTPHATTNIQTIQAFVSARFTTAEAAQGKWRVEVAAAAGHNVEPAAS